MDMVSYLSSWDDDYIPEGLIACHGTVVVAQIYEIWCGVIWYVCMVNMEVLVGKIQLTCQHVLKFSRSLIIRSYKTWKCETCILLSSQWVWDIVRPKSTYGLDHDFKYIVSQDFSRVKSTGNETFDILYMETDHDLWRSYFFHLFPTSFSIYIGAPGCRWDLVCMMTRKWNKLCWGRPVHGQ